MSDLKYAKIDSITRRLAGRITVVNLTDYGITGITGTQIGTDMISIIGREQENFVDLYLSMIYEMPLKHEHPFLQGIVEKLIVSDIYYTYFPTVSESSENTDSFAGIMRQQALNNLQCLFSGLGIFVAGSDMASNQIQNDEGRTQMANKALLLPGEIVKKFIGYDYDGDNISDSDLYKLNTNVATSFYTTGDFERLSEVQDVVDGVRVRPRSKYRNNLEVDFWGDGL